MTTPEAIHRLDAADSTVVISAGTTVPRLLWFGPTLPQIEDEAALLSLCDNAVPQAKLDAAVPLTLFPDGGSGFMGPVALEGHRHGQHFAYAFKLEKVNRTSSSLEFVLHDAVAQLRVSMLFALDAESTVLTIGTTLENAGSTSFRVNKLASATLPIADTHTECLSLNGRWGLEFQQRRNNIDVNQLRIKNTSGRTSHEYFPGCVVGQPSFDSQRGQLLGVHLGYSGNYELTVERLSTGEGCLQAGLAILPGEITLEPGESMDTPPLYVCAAHGLNQMSQRFHRFMRHNILPPYTRKPRPIHANSWEALYFDHDEQTLLGLVDAVATTGAERFVLDDGWFHGRRDDTTGLGDWWVDKTIYPNGLHTLVDHVRKHGMQFGLWFEPEMVSPVSELYKNHPEWALHVQGHTTPLARNQLVLNLGLEDVRNYLYDAISSLVSEYKIDYIKWDMNRDLVLPGGEGKAGVVEQVRGVYQLLDRLTQAFPDLEIESCASGGARADYGVLGRTGRVWTSDSIDPIDRLTIQRGFGLFFPPEIMGAHVGHDVAHLTGRAATLQTRAIVALQGQYGYELDARKIADDERGQLQHYADRYKQHREWLAECLTWTVPTRDSALFVQGQVSADQSSSVWTVVTAQSLDTSLPERIRLLGLDSDKQYKVTTTGWQALKAYGKHTPSWVEEGAVVSGAVLMNIGLNLPVMPAQSALLIDCLEA